MTLSLPFNRCPSTPRSVAFKCVWHLRSSFSNSLGQTHNINSYDQPGPLLHFRISTIIRSMSTINTFTPVIYRQYVLTICLNTLPCPSCLPLNTIDLCPIYTMLPIFFSFIFFNSPLVILELCFHFMCLNMNCYSLLPTFYGMKKVLASFFFKLSTGRPLGINHVCISLSTVLDGAPTQTRLRFRH